MPTIGVVVAVSPANSLPHSVFFGGELARSSRLKVYPGQRELGRSPAPPTSSVKLVARRMTASLSSDLVMTGMRDPGGGFWHFGASPILRRSSMVPGWVVLGIRVELVLLAEMERYVHVSNPSH